MPALNEAQTIAAVVDGVAQYGAAVVVDDGSADGTGALAEKAGATVLVHPVMRGYDAALATGFAWADANGFDIVASIDADAQHDASILGALIEPIELGRVEMVLGVRARSPRF